MLGCVQCHAVCASAYVCLAGIHAPSHCWDVSYSSSSSSWWLLSCLLHSVTVLSEEPKLHAGLPVARLGSLVSVYRTERISPIYHLPTPLKEQPKPSWAPEAAGPVVSLLPTRTLELVPSPWAPILHHYHPGAGPAFAQAVLQEDPSSPFLQHTEAPPKGGPPLWCIYCSPNSVPPADLPKVPSIPSSSLLKKTEVPNHGTSVRCRQHLDPRHSPHLPASAPQLTAWALRGPY